MYIQTDLSGNTVWPQVSNFLSTLNVNIARFARIAKWNFFLWFSNILDFVCFFRKNQDKLKKSYFVVEVFRPHWR